MKNLKIFFGIASIALFLTSCSVEEFEETETQTIIKEFEMPIEQHLQARDTVDESGHPIINPKKP